MEKIQKSIAYKSLSSEGLTVLIIDERETSSSLFCSVCNFIMSDASDFNHYDEYGCCSRCAMKFAESRKDKWNKGWRPSKEDLDIFINQERIQSPDFILD